MYKIMTKSYFILKISCIILKGIKFRNPSFGLATKAKGL